MHGLEMSCDEAHIHTYKPVQSCRKSVCTGVTDTAAAVELHSGGHTQTHVHTNYKTQDCVRVSREPERRTDGRVSTTQGYI